MRIRVLLLSLAIALISLAAIVFVRTIKWSRREPVIPPSNTTSNGASIPTPLTFHSDSVTGSPRAGPLEPKVFGNISGRVIDALSRPVANAAVHAWSLPPAMGMVPSAITNSRGVFIFKGLETGKYYLSVEKEFAGYPDTDNRFYSAGFVENPNVVVQVEKTVWCGDVRLGPKAAKLAGTVRDAVTNKLIVSTFGGQPRQLVLSRAQDPNNSYTPGIDINGGFEVLVPPVPFTLEVSVAGYQRKEVGSLQLKSGETKRLDIFLVATK